MFEKKNQFTGKSFQAHYYVILCIKEKGQQKQFSDCYIPEPLK